MHRLESSDPPTTIFYFLPPPLPAFSLPPFPPTEVERRGGQVPPPFVCVGFLGMQQEASKGRGKRRLVQSRYFPPSLTYQYLRFGFSVGADLAEMTF